MGVISRTLTFTEENSFFLFGPRQTGKSTLINHFFRQKKCLFYNLLESETFRKLSTHPELLRQEVETATKSQGITHIIIDEIQRIPELLNEIHAILESLNPPIFVLTGSSARKLKRTHANMLGGRAWTYRLYPLSFLEIGADFDLERVLRFGSLPKVYLAQNDSDRSEILRSYVDTYLKEEIEVEARLRNIGSFLRFLPISASENGALINFTNIARETMLSLNTVRAYYQILEDTLLGFFLFPMSRSARKMAAGHPRFYFFDCGVVRALTGKLNASLLPETEEYGRAFEHMVLCEILRHNAYQKLDFNISFYRTERGAEVDCVIKTPTGRIIAVEIKSTPHPELRHCSGLRSFREVFPNAECIVACRCTRPVELGPYLALPWQEAVMRVIGRKTVL